MANVKDIMGDMDYGDAYYDPEQDFDGIMPVGLYFAHITGLSIKENFVLKNKFLTDIFEPEFEVAEANAESIYEIDGKEVSGKAFVGRKLKAKGFFRFKKPNPKEYPNLSDSQGSNKRYMEFVEALNLPLEELDGRWRLPYVAEEDIDGIPVIVRVIHDKWTGSDGEERSTPKVLEVMAWADGKRKMTDVPF